MTKAATLDEIESSLRKGRYAHIVPALRRIVRQQTDLGSDWGRVAQMAGKLQDYQSALTAAERRLKAQPGNVAARLKLAEYAHSAGRFDEARAAVEAAHAAAPGNAGVIYAMGFTRARAGETDEAIEYYRRAVTLDASKSMAWSVIAKLRDFDSPDDPDIEAMRRDVKRTQNANPNVRAPLQYALGYAMESLGDHTAAFKHIHAGAELMKSHRRYNPDSVRRVFQGAIDVFDPEMIARSRGVRSNRPIFVVGAPRAGTTLVETILLSHSDVHEGGELPYLSVASYALQPALEQAPGQFLQACRRNGIPRPFYSFGQAYLGLASERFGHESRFVDSTTTTPWQAGYILTGLPDAKIVWLTRNRQDALWAIYKVFFPGAQSFSYDFDHIMHRLDWVERLRDHFASLAPETILPVAYEDLARDPETWIRKILAHCDLPYEDAVMDFHKSKRVVNTASFTQVRQPITTKSIGSWKKYEEQLGPIYERLGLTG